MLLFSFFLDNRKTIPVENKIKACVIPWACVSGMYNEDIKKIHDDKIIPNDDPIPKIVNTSKKVPSKRLKISYPKNAADKTRKMESKYIILIFVSLLK